MKIIEINKCLDCNGCGITRIFSGTSDGIFYLVKVNEKDYKNYRNKLMTIGTISCSKCKGTGETKKTIVRNKVKTIEIYNNGIIKGWKILK